MSGITVIVVPTWGVWLFAGIAVVNIAQYLCVGRLVNESTKWQEQ